MASPDLSSISAPPIELVVSAWLAPWARGTRRRAGDPLPFRLIHAVAGSASESVGEDWVVSIHTFAADDYSAMLEAKSTDDRMMLLARNPQSVIVLPEPDGRAVNVDYVTRSMLPTRVDYQDPNVVRYVARYGIGLSYSAV